MDQLEGVAVLGGGHRHGAVDAGGHTHLEVVLARFEEEEIAEELALVDPEQGDDPEVEPLRAVTPDEVDADGVPLRLLVEADRDPGDPAVVLSGGQVPAIKRGIAYCHVDRHLHFGAPARAEGQLGRRHGDHPAWGRVALLVLHRNGELEVDRLGAGVGVGDVLGNRDGVIMGPGEVAEVERYRVGQHLHLE